MAGRPRIWSGKLPILILFCFSWVKSSPLRRYYNSNGDGCHLFCEEGMNLPYIRRILYCRTDVKQFA